MEQLIDKLIETGTAQFMDESRRELLMSDEIYLKDESDEKDLEQRYESLSLTKEQRMLVNDYMACMRSADARCSDISYMAGMRDAVRILKSMGALREEAE